MKKIIFLLFMLLATSALAVVEIKNVMKFQPSGTLIQGDSVKIEIQLWPVDSYDEKKFLEYKDKIFLENFYVNDIKASRSENNYDVILLEVDAIATTPAPSGKVVSLDFGSYTTSSSLPFEIEKMEDFDGQFIILNQAVDYVGKNFGLVIFGLCTLILIGIFIFSRKRINKFFKKNKVDQERKIYFQTLFHNAKERNQFEEIYQKKNEWLDYIPEKNQTLQFFFKTLEEHQYKKSWTKEELFEVKSAFDKIRGGIK